MMEQRLIELRAEYDRGLRQIVRLERQREELQRTLLRINGAIQVLEELLAQNAAGASGDGAGSDASISPAPAPAPAAAER